MIKKGCCWL